jgi:heme oxygenase (biliverdin-IX-beta and delta-forming)
MTTSTPTSDKPDTGPHETAGPPLRGDTRSIPSHAELARTLVGNGGIATLSTLTDSGHPYSSIAPYSVLADGAALVCVSSLAEHTQNLRRDPRASMLVGEATPDEIDPLSLARVTLIGAFVPYAPTSTEIEAHLVVHPFARHYVGFDDFSWWRFDTLNLRYVGGFGFMGWASADEYASATVDPIIDHARPMIEHLNADHADACTQIVQHLAGIEAASSATVTAVDRYGMTFDVFGGPDSTQIAIGRVAFPEPLTSPDEVRAASVELVRRAREQAG